MTSPDRRFSTVTYTAQGGSSASFQLLCRYYHNFRFLYSRVSSNSWKPNRFTNCTVYYQICWTVPKFCLPTRLETILPLQNYPHILSAYLVFIYKLFWYAVTHFAFAVILMPLIERSWFNIACLWCCQCSYSDKYFDNISLGLTTSLVHSWLSVRVSVSISIVLESWTCVVRLRPINSN